MNSKIHPYLIARLVAVQEAFGQPGAAPAYKLNSNPFEAKKDSGNNWKELLKEVDDKGDQGGGGGTAKGHRGKNAVHAAKEAMRKLGRTR